MNRETMSWGLSRSKDIQSAHLSSCYKYTCFAEEAVLCNHDQTEIEDKNNSEKNLKLATSFLQWVATDPVIIPASKKAESQIILSTN